MSKKVKNKSISEEISSLFTRKTLAEPDSDDGELNLAESAEVEEGNQLGGIRKQNAPLLEEISSKYKGIPSSRDLDSDSSQEVHEDSDNEKSSEDEENSEEEENFEEEENSEQDENSEDEVSERPDSEEEEHQSSDAPRDVQLLSQKSTETSKGLCVKNQLKIWENLIQIRIRSQSLMTLSNRLPHPEHFQECKEFSDFSSLASEVQTNVTNVLNQLVEAQNILLSTFPDTKESLKRGLYEKIALDDEEFPSKKPKLEFASKSSCESFRNLYRDAIGKWSERIKSSKAEKPSDTPLNAIDEAMASKSNLVASSRICRGNYELFREDYGEIDEESGKKISPEVYDDTDFYHEILSELIESKCTPNLDSTSNVQKKPKNSTKKIVDTKASKGRRIRYVVHKKMVNFMAPNPHSSWTEEAKDELFSSIFGSGQ